MTTDTEMKETIETNVIDESFNDLSLDDSKNPSHSLKSQEPRALTDEEMLKLSNDKQLVSEFKQRKFELDAKKNWDLFYRRNKTNFFKDRYWTFREFDELNSTNDNNATSSKTLLLEIGCGVGNFIFPLLKQNPNMIVFACDFSNDAIALLKANAEYDTTRSYAFVCDVTQEGLLRQSLSEQQIVCASNENDNVLVDIVTLIFVLSAIHPTKMRAAVRNIAQIMKPDATLLIRDYGVNDHSMIRFKPGHKLDDKFYVRQDGTRTFFFTLNEIDDLFLEPFEQNSAPLFEKCSNEYVFRETVNIKENLRVPRVFIQAKFKRTSSMNF